MSVTNKPNSNDPIVQRVKDQFGEKFIATTEFWNFLDELVGQTNETTSQGFDYTGAISEINARLAQIEYDITDDPFTVDSTGWTIDTTYITADWAKA